MFTAAALLLSSSVLTQAPIAGWVPLVENQAVTISIDPASVLAREADRTVEFVVKRVPKSPLTSPSGAQISYFLETIFVMCNFKSMVISYQEGRDAADKVVYENAASKLYIATGNPGHATTVIVYSACSVLESKPPAPSPMPTPRSSGTPVRLITAS